MTRTYAGRKLLEHGPLTFKQFVEITGWPKNTAADCLTRLRRNSAIRLGWTRSDYGNLIRLYRIAPETI